MWSQSAPAHKSQADLCCRTWAPVASYDALLGQDTNLQSLQPHTGTEAAPDLVTRQLLSLSQGDPIWCCISFLVGKGRMLLAQPSEQVVQCYRAASESGTSRTGLMHLAAADVSQCLQQVACPPELQVCALVDATAASLRPCDTPIFNVHAAI